MWESPDYDMFSKRRAQANTLAQPELRLDIWRRITNNAKREIFIKDKTIGRSRLGIETTELPPTTGINRESRAEAFKILYPWTIPGHPLPLMINLKYDTLSIPVNHLDPRFFKRCYGSMNKKIGDVKGIVMRMNTPCHFAHGDNIACPILQHDGPLEKTLQKCTHVERLTLEYEPSMDKMEMNMSNLRWVGGKAKMAKKYLDNMLHALREERDQATEGDHLLDIRIICTDPRRRRRKSNSDNSSQSGTTQGSAPPGGPTT